MNMRVPIVQQPPHEKVERAKNYYSAFCLSSSPFLLHLKRNTLFIPHPLSLSCYAITLFFFILLPQYKNEDHHAKNDSILHVRVGSHENIKYNFIENYCLFLFISYPPSYPTKIMNVYIFHLLQKLQGKFNFFC